MPRKRRVPKVRIPQEEPSAELQHWLETGADLVECAIDVLELRRKFRQEPSAAASFLASYRGALCAAAVAELGLNERARWRREAARSNGNGGG